MELNLIVLARSSILCRKIFPNQGGGANKGPLKDLGNPVAIPVRRLACALRPAWSCKGIAVLCRNLGQDSSSLRGLISGRSPSAVQFRRESCGTVVDLKHESSAEQTLFPAKKETRWSGSECVRCIEGFRNGDELEGGGVHSRALAG